MQSYGGNMPFEHIGEIERANSLGLLKIVKRVIQDHVLTLGVVYNGRYEEKEFVVRIK